MTYPDPASGSWHLDRRVPLALIGTIVLQTSFGIWWAATLAGTVNNNAAHIQEMKTAISALEREVVSQGREDTSITRQLEATNASLDLLRQDVRVTNELLRQIMANGNGTHLP